MSSQPWAFWTATLTWALCTSGGRSSQRPLTNRASWWDLIKRRNVVWEPTGYITGQCNSPHILRTVSFLLAGSNQTRENKYPYMWCVTACLWEQILGSHSCLLRELRIFPSLYSCHWQCPCVLTLVAHTQCFKGDQPLWIMLGPCFSWQVCTLQTMRVHSCFGNIWNILYVHDWCAGPSIRVFFHLPKSFLHSFQNKLKKFLRKETWEQQ